jgi:uncharacterized protein
MSELKVVNNKFLKILLIISGTISLVLGIIGIFIPLLPTTPFLLLTAACYIRSSDKFYRKLIENKIIGNYIRNYREKKTLPFKIKITSIAFLWITILYAIIFVAEYLWLRILLGLIAAGVTYHILKLRTIRRNVE